MKLSFLAYPTNHVLKEQMMIEIGATFAESPDTATPISPSMRFNGVTTIEG